jgi:large subunit ribosomal protein L31
MKANIHPNYQQTTITCVGCGTSFTTGSTAKDIRVDICSNCHPFYTGQKKLIDTEGRVEKFEKRLARKSAERKPQKAVVPPVLATAKAKQPVAAPSPASTDRPKSLREMLQEAANSK